MAIIVFRGAYRFLSNFYPAVVQLDGDSYPTVEHAYQAAKTTPEHRLLIRMAATPGVAKREGQRVPLRAGWMHRRVDIMRELLHQKFAQEPLRTQLLATEDQLLVEGNTWGDTFWGVCNGVGENWLGRLLMALRTELRNTAE